MLNHTPETTPGLEPEWIDQIKTRYRDNIRELKAYEILIRKGDQCNSQDKRGVFFVIINGAVDIINTDEMTEKDLRIEHKLSAPTFVGEIRALNPGLRATRMVQASGPVTAIEISWKDLNSWNFEGRPWREIYQFVRHLAEERLHQLPEADQMAVGYNPHETPQAAS